MTYSKYGFQYIYIVFSRRAKTTFSVVRNNRKHSRSNLFCMCYTSCTMCRIQFEPWRRDDTLKLIFTSWNHFTVKIRKWQKLGPLFPFLFYVFSSFLYDFDSSITILASSLPSCYYNRFSIHKKDIYESLTV